MDLRSDTVTRPTAAMRTAMAEAEVGDDGYGEDPTVRRLEAAFAARVGKPAALFVPSGTMSNQIALRLLGRPGTLVICGARQHIVRHEAAAAGMNAAVQLQPVTDVDGVLDPDQVDHAIKGADHHMPSVSAIAIENTHMAAGGAVWPDEPLRALMATRRPERIRPPSDNLARLSCTAAVTSARRWRSNRCRTRNVAGNSLIRKLGNGCLRYTDLHAGARLKTAVCRTSTSLIASYLSDSSGPRCALTCHRSVTRPHPLLGSVSRGCVDDVAGRRIDFQIELFSVIGVEDPTIHHFMKGLLSFVDRLGRVGIVRVEL